MGIVVLMVAVHPRLTVGGAQLIDAEAPGPGIEKLTPRIAETARALWGIYLGLTAAEMALLYGLHVAGLAPNMTLYNAIAHGLTTTPRCRRVGSPPRRGASRRSPRRSSGRSSPS
jgi:trk system potassium uptake protein TrkH